MGNPVRLLELLVLLVVLVAAATSSLAQPRVRAGSNSRLGLKASHSEAQSSAGPEEADPRLLLWRRRDQGPLSSWLRMKWQRVLWGQERRAGSSGVGAGLGWLWVLHTG